MRWVTWSEIIKLNTETTRSIRKRIFDDKSLHFVFPLKNFSRKGFLSIKWTDTLYAMYLVSVIAIMAVFSIRRWCSCLILLLFLTSEGCRSSSCVGSYCSRWMRWSWKWNLYGYWIKKYVPYAVGLHGNG